MFTENPFPGPRPLTTAEGSLFHGRRSELRLLRDKLQFHRIVLVHAQTGAGKSSLVEAGLLHQVREEYRVPQRIFRPALMLQDRQREGSLTEAAVVAAISTCFDGLAAEHPPADAQELLQAVFGGNSIGALLVVVDQAEEIFTRFSHSRAAATFFRALGTLSQSESIWMVIVVRDDFFGRVMDFAPFFVGRLEQRFRVPLLTRDETQGIILQTLNCSDGSELQPGLGEVLDQIQLASRSGKSLDEKIENGERVSPLFLQAICRSWFEAARAAASNDGAADERGLPRAAAFYYLGRKQRGAALAGDALVAFVDQAFARAVTTNAPSGSVRLGKEARLREWCENRLVDRAYRTIVVYPDDPPEGLAEICRGYFVTESKEGEKSRIELSHDRFVEALAASNELFFEHHSSFIGQSRRRWSLSGRTSGLLLGPVGMVKALKSWRIWSRAEREYFFRSMLRPSYIGILLLAVLAISSQQWLELLWKLETLEAQYEDAEIKVKAAKRESESFGEQAQSQLRAQQSNFSSRSLRNSELGLAQAVLAFRDLRNAERSFSDLAKGSNDLARSSSIASAVVTSALVARTMDESLVRRRAIPTASRTFVAAGQFDDAGNLCFSVGSREKPSADSPSKLPAYRFAESCDLQSRNLVATQDGLEVVTGSKKSEEDSPIALLLRKGFEPIRLQPRAPLSDGGIPTHIVASFLQRVADGIRGLSFVEGGGVYLWSLAEQDLLPCLEKSGDCFILSLEDRIDRFIGGTPVAVWLDPEAGARRFRVLSHLGEWVEVSRPKRIAEKAIESLRPIGPSVPAGIPAVSEGGIRVGVIEIGNGRYRLEICSNEATGAVAGRCDRPDLPENSGRPTTLALGRFRNQVGALAVGTEMGLLDLFSIRMGTEKPEAKFVETFVAHVGPVAAVDFEKVDFENVDFEKGERGSAALRFASVGSLDNGVYFYQILDPKQFGSEEAAPSTAGTSQVVGPINIHRHNSSLRSALFQGSRLVVNSVKDQFDLDLDLDNLVKKACGKFQGEFPEDAAPGVTCYCKQILEKPELLLADGT